MNLKQGDLSIDTPLPAAIADETNRITSTQTPETVPAQYINREWLIDELEEIVYLSDIGDYTLLYLNKTGRSLTGVRMGEVERQKCYRVLQGRETPCPFCTNAKLSRDKFYVWEYENPYLGKTFIVKDKLVEWEGRQVRMEIAVDVGDRMKGGFNITSKYHMETVILESLQVLNTADSLESAIDRTLQLIADFYEGERAYIIEIDREHGVARNTYEWCREGVPSQKQSLQNVPLEAIPYIFETFDKKQHLILSRAEEIRFSYPSEYRFLTSRNTYSLFAVPFEDSSSFSGYVGVDNPNINQDTIRLLDSIAYNISNEIKKRRLYERLQYEAEHDVLSGLLNRGSFVRYQEQLRAGGDFSCGLVTADINGLKQLNRDYGHEKGDETIKRATEIMSDSFPEAKIFRLSGDEFVTVATGRDYGEFIGRVRRMNERLDSETPSGVALGCTWVERLSDFDALMHHAEELMLVNKQLYYKNSDSRRKHYSPEILKNLTAEMELGYYRIYLQPKINSDGECLVAAEALVRYRPPGQETTMPGRFVPVLEKERLIRYLDFYMLEEVCRLLARWQKEGKRLIPISVNFSRVTLLEKDLYQIVTGIKDKYHIPHRMILIEITERIGDIERSVIAAIGSHLRKAGFGLSLDDFGADYANMSILSLVHFDEVKLDKSLIDHLADSETNRTVVKGIVEMCRSLSVNCVAEGVENRSQLELLRSFGCTVIQGYYYSRPVEIAEFEKKLL